MRFRSALLVLALCAPAAFLRAQQAGGPPGDGQSQRAAVGPIPSDRFHTVYVRLGQQAEGLMYEPNNLQGPQARIAIVYSHTSANVFQELPAIPMAQRGYRILMVNYRGGQAGDDAYLPAISRGIAYMRTLPGVQKVVALGHSGGGHLMALYENVAEHGSAVCKGPEKLYPCRDGLDGLQKPDGLVLLDPTTGAFHAMSAIDPAEGVTRNAALDMFSPANGYDLANKRATYSQDFARRFYAGQTARNAQIIDAAVARLAAIKSGKGAFTDDEPLTIPGMGESGAGASRLYHPDPTFASQTKKPHLLLRADGTEVQVIVKSVRPPTGQQALAALHSLDPMSINTTVRNFLRTAAVRTGPDFAITKDDIVGVDWKSAFSSTPANAEGVTVPALVMVMGCHYLIVPGEMAFDRMPSKDKSFAAVEGSAHVFTPCQPQYGDTNKRVFDYVDAWLVKPGRF